MSTTISEELDEAVRAKAVALIDFAAEQDANECTAKFRLLAGDGSEGHYSIAIVDRDLSIRQFEEPPEEGRYGAWNDIYTGPAHWLANPR